MGEKGVVKTKKAGRAGQIAFPFLWCVNKNIAPH